MQKYCDQQNKPISNSSIYKTTLYTVLFLYCFNFGYSQSFSNALNNLRFYKTTDNSLQQANALELFYYNTQLNILKHGVLSATKIPKTVQPKTVSDSCVFNLIQGDYYLYANNYKYASAYQSYAKAIYLAQKTTDTLLIVTSFQKILHQIHKTRFALEGYNMYLNLYKPYCFDANEKANYLWHRFNYLGSEFNIEKIDSLKIAYQIAKGTENKFLTGKLLQMVGIEQLHFKNNLDSSLIYYNKAVKYLSNTSLKFYKNELFGLYGNIGIIQRQKNNLNKAATYLLKADSITLPKYRMAEKIKLSGLLSEVYKLKKNYIKAINYLERSNAYSDSLNEYNKALKITEINTKYKTAEKEKENLILQKQKTRNKNIAIALGGTLTLSTIIAFLIFKNNKRKQKLKAQAKAIEIQKLSTVLKEQELKSIDAMIEGQEKERQRIANDLHDDLGSLMATIKLHFNALSKNNSKDLFNKTNILIEEAYQKIRGIAHAKNSGVIANKGLLKAVKHMAKTISETGKTKIDVVDFGLTTRIENSLELTIFRIIQELITNIIKHANATLATIHLTNHNDSINILIEDNGIGFNTKQITKTSSGIGISSIDKRVEHLNGQLTIESEHNQGTTVIIDIPI